MDFISAIFTSPSVPSPLEREEEYNYLLNSRYIIKFLFQFVFYKPFALAGLFTRQF